jgi:hypothetical protein
MIPVTWFRDRDHKRGLEAAFLDLPRATDMPSRGLGRVLKSEGLSSTQYNVLRILRAAPDGLPCFAQPSGPIYWV